MSDQLPRELSDERSEVEVLRRRLDHAEQWYATRWARLADELRDTEVWERVACIMANGTGDVLEPPTYAQQMNVLRHERDAAIADVERLHVAIRKAHEHWDADRDMKIGKVLVFALAGRQWDGRPANAGPRA